MSAYNLIYPLADILQIPIRLYQADNLFELRGNRDFKLPIGKGAGSELAIPVKVIASYLSKTESSVLVHLRKKLYAYVCFYKVEAQNDEACFLFVLSQGEVPLTKFKKDVDGKPYLEAYNAIKPLIKAGFTKGTNDVKWEALDLGKVS